MDSEPIHSDTAKSPNANGKNASAILILSQIWYDDSHYGVGFAESEREKEVNMAGNGAANASETVIVAMK